MTSLSLTYRSPNNCAISLAAPLNGMVKIQNVVAVADLHQPLDLEAILRVFPAAKYRPEEFPGLVYYLKKPRTTLLLFTSGKMVCAGAKSTRSATAAITRVIVELQRNGIVIMSNPEIQITNIVSTNDFSASIDLEAAAERLSKTIYEPEQFPGLIYRMDDPKTVFLLFATGKLVCTGAKKEADVYAANEKLRLALEANHLIAPLR